MRELQPLDPESLRQIEEFLSAETGTTVRLGPVWLAAGRVGRAVAAAARASGITFGGIICLDAAGVHRLDAATPALDALGALLVHECVHVWQYRRDGTARFLSKYLYSYFISLYRIGSIACSARASAYLAIEAEVEARELERRWREQ